MARIAMPVADGFEDSEFSVPYERLKAAGHEVVVLGLSPGDKAKGKAGKVTARIDEAVASTLPGSWDALVIPGGHSPDTLRTNAAMVDFVRGFAKSGKLIAAICHGPQLLIEADAVRGRTLTSWPSVRKDLENAGARWVDEEVVTDGNLVTSRKPEDLDAFCDAIKERLATPVRTWARAPAAGPARAGAPPVRGAGPGSTGSAGAR